MNALASEKCSKRRRPGEDVGYCSIWGAAYHVVRDTGRPFSVSAAPLNEHPAAATALEKSSLLASPLALGTNSAKTHNSPLHKGTVVEEPRRTAPGQQDRSIHFCFRGFFALRLKLPETPR